MARTIKAQTIANLPQSVDAKDTAEMLLSDSGVASRVSISTLKSVFGTAAQQGSQNLQVNIDEFSPNGFSKVEQKIAFNDTPVVMSTGMRGFATNAYEIKVDCAVYARIETLIGAIGNCMPIEIQIQTSGGDWVTICSTMPIDGQGAIDGVLCVHFKAYAGLKVRGFLRASDTSKSSYNIADSGLYLSMIKNDAPFGLNSRSYVLTVSGTASTDGYYSSNEIEFPYHGLINVNGYFSCKTGTSSGFVGDSKTKDAKYNNAYLQYTDPEGHTVNLARRIIADTNTNYNFGTFYVQRGGKLRIAQNSIPSTTAAHTPYQSCTAIIFFDAITREGDGQGAHDENMNIPTLDEVQEMFGTGTKLSVNFKENPTATKENLVLMSDVSYTDPLYINWNASEDAPWNRIEKYELQDNKIDYKYDWLSHVETGRKEIEFTDNIQKFSFSSSNPNAETINALKTVVNMSVSCLEDIKFGESVQEIEDYAFFNCVNLSALRIPSTVKNFDAKCTCRYSLNDKDDKMQLRDVVFEGNETYATEMISTFAMCKHLSSINLENLQVSKIGKHAFVNTALDCVNVPNGCEVISGLSFANCPNLLSVILPTSLNSVSKDIFTGCSKMTTTNGDVFLKMEKARADYIDQGYKAQAVMQAEIVKMMDLAKLYNVTQLNAKKAYLLDKNFEFIYYEDDPTQHFYCVIKADPQVNLDI